MLVEDMWLECVEALGEMEADRLVVQTFGSIKALFDYLVEEGNIEID